MENNDNKASATNNDDSVNSGHGGFKMEHVRFSSWCSVLKRLVKFLLFREDHPKHFVWADFQPIHLALVLPFAVAPSVGLVIAGFKFGGILGFFACHVLASVLPLEILHCIFDR